MPAQVSVRVHCRSGVLVPTVPWAENLPALPPKQQPFSVLPKQGGVQGPSLLPEPHSKLSK